jgi:hypothetical protein
LPIIEKWTQLIDGTMDFMPLSKDLTHRTAEPTTIFRASEASWSKEMNGIGKATLIRAINLYWAQDMVRSSVIVAILPTGHPEKNLRRMRCQPL